ncbi:hypothetical protein DIC75_00145 [Methanoculleus sp. CWC-02]|uniref:UPF0033 domain-containing protein n=1 Tax=Methanoculleus oceani TaxID=2184756 RepID=A0ABD4TA57_9EURY|nr:sulfurtransferase TusA family protein [Methanoculleus sp. CWC-02]MCM2464735.1 hypothetical protein [Methanoculleus sp. CWC-02]
MALDPVQPGVCRRRITVPGFARAPRNGRWREVEPEKKPAAVVDCIGLYCPMPIAMTKEAIERLDVGEVLLIEADDPAAEEDIRRWANRVGHEIVKFEKDDGVMRFSIRKMK